MAKLFEVKPIDYSFYKERLENFLPDKIIDIHTHVYLNEFKAKTTKYPKRSVTWPSRVAKDNPIEDLIETYALMFPGKMVIPQIFSSLRPDDDIEAANDYIQKCSRKYGFPGLIYSTPKWGGELLRSKIVSGGFYGCKVYLNFSKPYIPEKEIRIFDFLPHHQLKIINDNGWIVMLHIPRDGRLKDPVNLEQILEINRKYPNIKLIIAHVGRAYCNEDVDNAFEVLSEAKNLLFDFSANTNQWVFEQLINAVGPKRILFGSDMPILRMRTRRIVEESRYVNLVPAGLYGDISGDEHMREVEGEDADDLTFFMYEEIDAFKRAAENTGIGRPEIEDIFYNNAYKLFKGINENFNASL